MPLSFKPIDELWLRSQERLALGFKGDKKDLIHWVFLRILDTEYMNSTPYTLNMQSIASGGTTSTLELKDGNQQILDVTENYAGSVIVHAGLGYKTDLGAPDTLRIYHQFPLGGGNELGKVLGLESPVTIGDDYSYITAQNSPFDRPTEAGEFFVPYSFDIGVAFANKDPIDRVFPSMNIIGKYYLFEILNPKGDTETKTLISQIAYGKKKCRFKVMGPLNNPALYQEGLSKYWKVNDKRVDPIPLREARNLGGA